MREQRGSEPMARPGATRAEPGAPRRPAAGRMRPSPRRKGPRSRRRRRTRLWHGLLVLALALCLGGGLVAAVPPWRDAALTSALLITGEIGAPTDLPTVTLCRTERPGLHARSARRLSVPRGRVIAGTLAGAALRGVRRPYLIYLPPGYDLPLFRHHRYPVVYALHGAPGQARDWYQGGALNVVADRLIAACRIAPLILVMPDGNGGLGRDSEYINRPDGSEGDDTYVTRDVVAFVDRHFRTLPERRARALLGLSEGGYGAVNLLLRHPDRFAAAVAIAGYYTADPRNALHGDNPFGHDRCALAANDPTLRVAALPARARHQLHIFLYDGADDSEFGPRTRAFARVLARNGVPYRWEDRVLAPLPGVVQGFWRYHNWVYWRASARDALIHLSALFADGSAGRAGGA